jgi:hypothetical protein
MWMAAIGIALNILVLPGLGSLIMTRYVPGIGQLVLFIVGVLLCLSKLGVDTGGAMVMGAWIWGLVSGISAILDADRKRGGHER